MSDNISYLLLPKKFHLFHSRTANKPLNCKQIVHFVRSSMPGVSIDLERGQTRPGPAGLVSAPSLSLLRRRKVLLLFIAFVVLVGFTSFNAQQIPGASRSFKWVKDSMRPAQQSQTSPTGLGSSDSDLKGNSRTSGSGTDALRKLAAEQGLDPSSIDPPSIPTGSPPSTSEQILLFLQALSNPSYTVPLLEREWRKQLVPESESDFAASLEQVEIEAASPDLDLKMVSRSTVGSLKSLSAQIADRHYMNTAVQKRSQSLECSARKPASPDCVQQVLLSGAFKSPAANIRSREEELTAIDMSFFASTQEGPKHC